MKFRITCLVLAILFAFPSVGFVCATRVEKLEADIEALQIQFNDVQKRLNNDQTQLTSMILRADKKLDELSGTQDKSAESVAQQNVQLALELEQERAELANMRGRLEVQQKTIESLQESLQAVMGTISSTGGGSAVILPSDQAGLEAYILQKRTSGDTAALKTALTEYISRYSDDAKLEPYLAEYIGVLYVDNQYSDVITSATMYLQKYPNGPRKADVIYQMGMAGLNTGNCQLSMISFKELKKLDAVRAKDALAQAEAKCK